MIVQHNITAMNSNRMLGLTTNSLAKSTEKLSSGYRINRAADDAAGLSISEKMRKQIRGLDQASTNAEDGISAVQTAEGALNEVHSMLQRMNELAVQAANGTNSESDRTAIQNEIDQLTTEIDRVSETTKFNETYLLKGDQDATQKASFKLYDANGNALTADKAAAAAGELYADKNQKFKVADTGAAAKTANIIRTETVNDDLIFNLHVGADSENTNKISVKISQMSATGIGVSGLKVNTEDDATGAIDTISEAIQKVSSQRSALGAVQNRLEHTIDNLDNVVENTTSAESRIRDTDMAEEMVAYSKNNILQQAGQSMLAQANQANQGVLTLLQ